MEPATTEGLGGGLGVLQIALHHRVAAHEDLAQGRAVLRHRLQGLWIGHHQPIQGRITHTLAGFDPSPLLQRLFIPLLVPGADGDRAVDLGQAISVGDADAHLLDRTDHLGWWRSARDHCLHRVADGGFVGIGHVHQGVEHDGRATQVTDPVLADQVEDLLWIDPAQEHMGAGQGGDGPG